MVTFVWDVIGQPRSPLERASAKIRASMEILEDARRALLSRLIDHTPIYPPASMELADALAEHERARSIGSCSFFEPVDELAAPNFAQDRNPLARIPVARKSLGVLSL